MCKIISEIIISNIIVPPKFNLFYKFMEIRNLTKRHLYPPTPRCYLQQMMILQQITSNINLSA